MAVKATFQIDIGKKEDLTGEASIELDAREDGLNAGKKEFRGGDTIYFLLHRPPNLVIADIITSEGEAMEYGEVMLNVTDVLVFDYPTELSQRLSRTPYGYPSMRWTGKGLPYSPSFDDKKGEVYLPVPVPLTKPKRGIGVLKCEYTELATVIKLTTPRTVDDNPIYSIHGVIAGHIEDKSAI